ncbi:unnamed protein product [Somion occarium]|uniref:Uncharacterized protein n=1 Tax=Somion occarium TaxID=3059160 RepID=A0ABP1E6H5_9APHY
MTLPLDWHGLEPFHATFLSTSSQDIGRFPPDIYMDNDIRHATLQSVKQLRHDRETTFAEFTSLSQELSTCAKEARLYCMPGTAQQVDRLVNTWATYSQSYTRIIWRSRRIAERAGQTAQAFISFILQLTDQGAVSRSAADEIHRYKQTIARDNARSRDLVDDILALQRDVDTFYGRWQSVFSHPEYERTTTSKRLDRMLTSIRTKLSGVRDTIGRITTASACGSDSTIYAYSDDSSTNLLQEPQPDEPFVHIDAQATAFANLAKHFGIIASVWISVPADLHVIDNLIGTYVGTPDKPYMAPALQARLDRMHDAYAFLAELFSTYQRSVNNRSPVFKRG